MLVLAPVSSINTNEVASMWALPDPPEPAMLSHVQPLLLGRAQRFFCVSVRDGAASVAIAKHNRITPAALQSQFHRTTRARAGIPASPANSRRAVPYSGRDA